MSWTETGNRLSGELEQGTLQTDASSGQESVSSDNTAFTGTVSGSSVTLTLNEGLGSTTNITGSTTGNGLELNYPGQNGTVVTLNLAAGTASRYNRDLTSLQNRASQATAQAQQATVAQEQANQVAQDAQAVESDLSSLTSSMQNATGTASVASDLSQMQKDVNQTDRDLSTVIEQNGKTDSSTLCGDADTVTGDADTVQGDYDTIEGDQDGTSGDAVDIGAAVSQLQKDEATLAADRRSDPSAVPSNAPTAAQVADAIKTARTQTSAEGDTTSGALGQAKQMLAVANGYSKRAQAICSAAGE